MKRILLTSTALVAIAGAAAADISFSGEAEFSYNDLTSYGSTIEMTVSASQALDNGFTASASADIDLETGAFTAGDISVASDSASITYYVAGDGQEAGYIGEEVGKMSTLANIFEDEDNIDEDAQISASASIGGANISMSLDSAETYQIGVTTDLGGTALALGLDEDGSFGAQMSGSASSVDYTLAMGSDDNYGLSATTTAGGADITVDFGDAGWEVGASMALGEATVGLTFDDANDWEVSVGTALEDVSIGMTFDKDSDWEMNAGIAQGGISADVMFNSDDDVELTASYGLGNGLTAYVGYFDGTSVVTYFGAEYDMGGGATVVVSNASSGAAVADELGQEYAEGTTVAVSFSF